MPEEIKQKILKFLKNHSESEFSISKIKEEVGHAYPTILKWITVLAADPKGEITVRDFGNIKLVSYAGKCKTE